MAKAKSQSEKFKELAREAGCEDDESAFDEQLKRIANSSPPKDQKQPAKKKPAK